MIVVDASIVVKVVTQEADSERAIDRLEREAVRTAPDWLHAEVASALAKKVRLAGLPIKRARQSLAALPAVVPDLIPSQPLFGRTMELSAMLDHAWYDCLYLAVAIQQNCNVLTADRKFFDAAADSIYRSQVELLE